MDSEALTAQKGRMGCGLQICASLNPAFDTRSGLKSDDPDPPGRLRTEKIQRAALESSWSSPMR